jgi:hypothetical protein
MSGAELGDEDLVEAVAVGEPLATAHVAPHWSRSHKTFVSYAAAWRPNGGRM